MHRWKLSALAAAAFVSAALTTTDASALALGPLNVRSALGEKLNAEITIPQATTAEIDSLVARIASAEVFHAQGMDFSAAARSIQVQLQRNADGTTSLHLTSSSPIQEPFVDLVLETQWSTGHLVRSYTMLLDPPASQRTSPVITTAPQVAAPSVSVTPPNNRAASAPRQRSTPIPPPESSNTDSSDVASNVQVRAGDTAGRIANANRPSGVSLDQMLVAMLRSNPKAFINGNVNRIRAGAVVQMPSRDQALETSASEARQIVAAQSRDFNAYRRSLAAKAPQAEVQAADRSSSGQVQANVAETRPSAETPDKLTLSKGAVQNAVAEAQLAEQKQAQDQDSRLNELQRNLAELNELAQSSTTPTASVTTAPAATDAAPASAATPAAVEATQTASSNETAGTAAPTVEVPNATAAAAAETASAAVDDSASKAAEPAPAKPAPKPKAVVPPPPPEPEPSLLSNPLVPAGAGLVALLLGLLGYTAWKRRRAAQVAHDPSMGDSQLQPDSFFGGSGGQQVDTSASEEGATTMAYSPSQLDGGGDVDPVAEADVYLAYGRDVQAEEILKEALLSQPDRLSIYVKLAEIYVKRHDIKALESIARSMQATSGNQDPEWLRVIEMGRQMDPTHPFFASAESADTGKKPSSAFASAIDATSVDPTNLKKGSSAAPAAVAAAAAVQAPPEIDFNLEKQTSSSRPSTETQDIDDVGLELSSTLDSGLDVTADQSLQAPPTLVQDTQMEEGHSAHDLNDLDLDLSGFDASVKASAAAPAAPEPDLTLDSGLDIDLESPLPSETAQTSDPFLTPDDSEPQDGLDFDLGSLDLDLGADTEPAAPAEPVHNLPNDPLSTKLDLAQEFNAIGDSEGARALIEEVLAEASGPLKQRAQKMLSEID
ncbi:FimV/HubP family polar landmark protein [Comamonas sp. NoAH]|uniref:FimV/HubP family polar landmark protein n=1 Tax=Comamonas halotolerans TaxID=3041496 RepID=UPI0024E04149|nr:FimV/HubP family polar landmark protein [Comamonas sp. NoAH]